MINQTKPYLDLLTFIRRLGIPKMTEISQSRTQGFNGNYFATLCINLVNFGPLTLEFKGVNGLYPTSISSLAMFAWRRHC